MRLYLNMLRDVAKYASKYDLFSEKPKPPVSFLPCDWQHKHTRRHTFGDGTITAQQHLNAHKTRTHAYIVHTILYNRAKHKYPCRLRTQQVVLRRALARPLMLVRAALFPHHDAAVDGVVVVVVVVVLWSCDQYYFR